MYVTNRKQYVADAERSLARSLFHRTYRVKKAERKRVLGGLWLKLLVTCYERPALTVPWKLVGPGAQVGELLWLLGEAKYGSDEGWERPQLFEAEDPVWPEFFEQSPEARDAFARNVADCSWEEYVVLYRRHESLFHDGPLRPGLWLREDAEPMRETVERLLDLKK